jgi:hypothetical protein
MFCLKANCRGNSPQGMENILLKFFKKKKVPNKTDVTFKVTGLKNLYDTTCYTGLTF